MLPENVKAKELGRWLGMSQTRVRELAAAGVIQRAGPGQYPLEEAVRSYCGHLREQAAARRGDGPYSLPQERAQLARAQREAQELKTRKLSGDLVPAADLDRALITLASAVSSRLQSVAPVLAPQLAAAGTPAACEKLVAEAIADALHDLADAGEQAATRARG